MAQGCNLHIDSKDWQDIKKAASNGQIINIHRPNVREKARGMLQSAMKRPDQFMEILNDSNNISYQKAKLALEVAMIGETVPPHEKQKLVPALSAILKNHKSLPGIFEKIPKYRGPGSSSMSQHYELTATAKLCETGEARRQIKSSTGIDISIYTTDKVSFGEKYAAEYAYKSKGGTIEGDINIKRHVLEAPHAIDTKYTKGNVRRLNTENGFSDKLNHVSRALRDGQIRSFTYVTNAVFSKETKEMIFDANCKLIEHHAEEDKKLATELNKLLNRQGENNSANKVLVTKLQKNKDVVERFINTQGGRYELIGIAEEINYEP